MLFGNYNNLNMLQMSNYQTANPFFCNGSVTGSLFSGTNSIFNFNPFQSMMGMGGNCGLFTNCYGQPKWGAMLGFSLGGLALNIAGMAIGHAVSTRRENSAETIEADVNDLNDLIDTELDKLGDGVDESNYTKYDVKTESWYIEKDNEIKTKTLNDSDLASYQKTITDYETATKNQQTTTITKEQYELAKEKVKEHNEAQEARKALDKKVVAEQAKADKIIKKITELIEKRNNAEKALTEAQLDAADGNRAQRRGENNFEERFSFDEKTNAITEGKDKVRKKDVRYAILAYRNASEEDKEKWATRFQNLYEALSQEDKKDSNLKAAYGIICG